MESRAETTWHGDLASGSGTTALASGAAPPLSVTWRARTEESGGLTSPEELIAAAHASCYSMAFSHGLAEAGTPPNSIKTSATVTFGQTDGGWTVTKSALVVSADVSGISEEDFQAAALHAKDGCPISRALQGNVDITLDASLV